MRDATTGTTPPPRRPRGFTLTELLVVMSIIGILLAFILVAAQDGIRRAQERATQSLVAKLEAGVAERIEAILLRRADISLGHHAVAASYNAFYPASSDPVVSAIVSQFGYVNTAILSYQRAQVIAQMDLVRAELPDVFFVQTSVNSTYGARYPINFAGLDFPLGSGNYLVPLGAYSGGAPGQPTTGLAPGDPNQAIGIFGATFQAAAGIYKNLGYLPQGYDGIDNPTPSAPGGDGFIDDLGEGIGSNPLVGDPDNPQGPQVQLSALIQRRLAAHKQVTARSEMLYALLVEGVGPMGSVFNRDDFTNREVQDTDGDGLPEFVDAWNQPLQFYRWPIYYNNLSSTTAAGSGGIGYVQKGADPYNGIWNNQTIEARQTDPLDGNQTLTALPWWSSAVNTSPAAGGATYSYNAYLFMNYFHSLLDPNAGSNLGVGSLWDRSGFYSRRAFYSRFLILSGGPDQLPGVAEVPMSTYSTTVGPALMDDVTRLTLIENQAAAIDPSSRGGPLSSQVPSTPTAATITLQLNGGDDITNQGMASPTGGIR